MCFKTRRYFLSSSLIRRCFVPIIKIIGYNTGKEGVKCMVCQHYKFKEKFDYQPYIGNECHDFPMTVMNLGDFFCCNY